MSEKLENEDSHLSNPGKESLVFSPSKVSWAINSFVLETVFTAERKFLYFTISMFAAFFFWGVFTSTTVIVDSSGYFFNQSPPLPVTTERSFYVRKVLVKEGQKVIKGTVLISAKDDRLEEDLLVLNQKLKKLENNLVLLMNKKCATECTDEVKFASDSPLTFSPVLLKDSQIKQEVGSLEADLKTLNSSLIAVASLDTTTGSLRMRISANSKKISEIERRKAVSILAMEYEQLRSEVLSLKEQLHDIEISAKNNLLRSSERSMMTLNNLKFTLKVFHDTADIISPFHGRVSFEELKGEGQLISPGMTLLKISPEDNNVALNLEVMNQDISKIHRGLSAKLDIEAYPSSEFGVQDAIIDFIPVVDATNKANSTFKVVAKVSDKFIIKDGKKYELTAGMKTKAKIIIRNEKTIVYFMKKVFKLKDDVFGS
jgi:multidrug efflux pump subunit AcrA (membrane-fusion protein)